LPRRFSTQQVFDHGRLQVDTQFKMQFTRGLTQQGLDLFENRSKESGGLQLCSQGFAQFQTGKGLVLG
jgi:hypothetical protein